MSLPFQPVQDLVILVKQTREERRASGLVIPELAAGRDEALVVGVGPGRLLHDGTRRPMTLADGDVIVYTPSRGQAFRYHDTEYIGLREEHAIARVLADGSLDPLNDFVIAEKLVGEHVNPGGRIVIPDAADRREEAVLLRVGPGRLREDGVREPMGLRQADRVLYMDRMGDEFRVRDRALVAFREEHVLCVTDRLLSVGELVRETVAACWAGVEA